MLCWRCGTAQQDDVSNHSACWNIAVLTVASPYKLRVAQRQTRPTTTRPSRNPTHPAPGQCHASGPASRSWQVGWMSGRRW